MSIYDDLQSIVSGVMVQFAQGSVQLRKAVLTESDPWAPGSTTWQVYQLHAVVNGVKAYQIDGTLIKASDLIVVYPATDAPAPTLQDEIMIDGRRHVIKKIQANPGAGTVLTYNLFIAA